jgi:uncharacterized protein with HEPN domain
MHADASALLWDAREALRRAQRFTHGKTFDDYLAEEMLRAAVERQFEILGEALAQLRRVDGATAARVRALPQAVGLRNVLVHGYASVDHRIVWGVVEAQLAGLSADLDSLIGAPPT